MFIVNGLNRMFAAPEDRNVAEVHSHLERFAPMELLSLGKVAVPINIRLLRSGSQDSPHGTSALFFRRCCRKNHALRRLNQALKY